ncbi:MAG: sulfatase [Cyclobacteriaceae bacterium]
MHQKVTPRRTAYLIVVVLGVVLLYIILAFIVSGCDNRKENVTELKKPNVILFVADDHGTDALGCYGNPIIQTPNLDKLASEGVRFTNAYCTSASCTASRSVILTGKYGHATASYGHVHDYHHFSTYDNVKSLSNILSESGYLTARVGKYHVAPEEVYKFDKVLEANRRNTVEMADKSAEVLNSDQPFFLYFCTSDPHRGGAFEPERGWESPDSFGNKKSGYPNVTPVKYNPEDVLVPSFLPDTRQSREELAQYYQSVSRVDQGFGRLMDLLKESGKIDNTIIIYISDNGIAFPGAKTTVYEPGIKLPCIIKTPWLKKAGTVNHSMISWVDLTPTILDMVDVEAETQFHGKSFYPILEESNAEGWDEIKASHTFHEITMYYPMRVIRKGNYKLIWNMANRLDYPFASDLWAASTWQGVHRNGEEFFGKRKVENYLRRAEFELYDLKNDPDEVVNIASKAAYADVLEKMKNRLKQFQLKTNDPWYIMWDNDASMQGSGVGL